MPPIYESETLTREELYEIRKRNRCQQCGGRLDVFMDFDRGKAFLACWDWPRTHHEGIEREAEPPFEPNIPTRREDMVEELGQHVLYMKVIHLKVLVHFILLLRMIITERI